MKKIDRIAKFIKINGSITKLEAAQRFLEFGLKGKINRLIRRGMNIETIMIDRPERQAYAKYTLMNKG